MSKLPECTERLGPDAHELGAPVNLDGRAELSVYEAAMLHAGRPLVAGGFFEPVIEGPDAEPEDEHDRAKLAQELEERRHREKLKGARVRVNLAAKSRDTCEALKRALEAGEIFAIVRRESAGGPVDILKTMILRVELIRWFAEQGENPDFLICEDVSPMAHGEAAPAPLDMRLLATRDQLVKAFGSFTGMNANWFHNLKYTPALLKARKFAGQGGRGHIREPYFCPFEVMLWLASPKRKKGSRVSEEKCWELLERHFPLVYAQHEVADPRE